MAGGEIGEPVSIFSKTSIHKPRIYIYKYFLKNHFSEVHWSWPQSRAWWVLLAYVKICLTPSAVVNIFYYWVDVLITQACLNLIGWTVSHDQLALSLNLGIFCTDDRSLEFITIADDACTTIQCNSNVRRLVTT